MAERHVTLWPLSIATEDLNPSVAKTIRQQNNCFDKSASVLPPSVRSSHLLMLSSLQFDLPFLSYPGCHWSYIRTDDHRNVNLAWLWSVISFFLVVHWTRMR